MKKNIKKHYIIIGLLFMGSGTIVNFFTPINSNIIDFLKGFGAALIIGGFILSLKNQKCKQVKES